jgi:hypothetical protein
VTGTDVEKHVTLQTRLYLIEVRAIVAFSQPRWLGVWNFAQCSWYNTCNPLLFSLDGSDLQALILGSLENLVSMKPVESFSRVLSGYHKGLTVVCEGIDQTYGCRR